MHFRTHPIAIKTTHTNIISMNYELTGHEGSNYSLAHSLPSLSFVFFPGPGLPFACLVLHPVRMNVQYPQNNSPLSRFSSGKVKGGEGRRLREKTNTYKVINCIVINNGEAGQHGGGGGASCAQTLRASAYLFAHQAFSPKTTPSGSRQSEGPFCSQAY